MVRPRAWCVSTPAPRRQWDGSEATGDPTSWCAWCMCILMCIPIQICMCLYVSFKLYVHNLYMLYTYVIYIYIYTVYMYTLFVFDLRGSSLGFQWSRKQKRCPPGAGHLESLAEKKLQPNIVYQAYSWWSTASLGFARFRDFLSKWPLSTTIRIHIYI